MDFIPGSSFVIEFFDELVQQVLMIVAQELALCNGFSKNFPWAATGSKRGAASLHIGVEIRQSNHEGVLTEQEIGQWQEIFEEWRPATGKSARPRSRIWIAQWGSIASLSNDNRRTYNSTSSVNLSGNTFVVRDGQAIRSLAMEIAAITKRQQRGRGLRMA